VKFFEVFLGDEQFQEHVYQIEDIRAALEGFNLDSFVLCKVALKNDNYLFLGFSPTFAALRPNLLGVAWRICPTLAKILCLKKIENKPKSIPCQLSFIE